MTYEVNAANAISETLDGETIVINLKSGNYYSMNETGSLIWNSVVKKFSTDSIVTFLTDRFAGEKDAIEKATFLFLAELKENELIIETTETGENPVEETGGEKKEFITPKIDRYDDMREMLLADPIHDVAEVGWPNLKKE